VIWANRALAIIRDNRVQVEQLVTTLLQVETLDREAFEQLMNEEEAPPVVGDLFLLELRAARTTTKE
jgi:hypothetical protein